MAKTWRNAKNVARVRKMRRDRLPISQIANRLGVSRNTVYACLRLGAIKISKRRSKS
jgi:hypothetical protein